MDDSILQDFIIESKDHLKVIEDGLMGLEDGGADVHSIFRSIHSIKGASGFLGLPNLSKLAHVMETLLQEYRDNVQAPETNGIDALLKGVDFLNTMMDDINNSESVDTSETMVALNGVLTKKIEGTAVANLPKAKKEEINWLEGMTFDVESLRKLIKTTDYAFVLRFSNDCDPQAVISELKQMGEVLGEHKVKGKEFRVLFTSVLDPDMIMTATDLDSEFIIELKEEHLNTVAAKVSEETIPAVSTTTKAGPAKPVLLAKSQPKEEEKQVKVEETVRITVQLLDRLMGLAGELVLVRNQQMMAVDREDSHQTRLVQQLDVVTTEMQDVIMKTRMQPVGHVLTKVPRMVRDLAKKLGKEIEVVLIGKDVELDKTLLEGLADPLTHMVRNSCDHGVEMPAERQANSKSGQGTLTIRACHEGGQILIEIKDDGKGINPEIIGRKAVEKGLISDEQLAAMSEKDVIQLIMLPGFSTAEVLSDVSGRGVGMDVVRSSLEKMGGTLEINSVLGQGTQMIIRLPLTLAIIQSLVVESCDRRFAIPQVNLEEMVCLYDKDVMDKVESVNGQETYRLRNELLPLVRLRDLLSHPQSYDEAIRSEITAKYRKEQECINKKGEKVLQSLYIAVVRSGSGRFGLIIDGVSNTEEIVVKPLHPYLDSVKIYSGATVLGDGRCALIIDPDGISRHCNVGLINDKNDREAKSMVEETHSALIFRWGADEAFAVFLPMIRHIERIKTSEIEKVGNREYLSIENQSVLLIHLDKYLNVSKGEMKEDMYLLLPKYTRNPFGILVSSLEDIVQVSAEISSDSAPEDGFLGSQIINKQMTLFVDVYRVLEKAIPPVVHQEKDSLHLKKLNILYAEDSLMFRQIVSGYIKEDGYDIDTAVNGLEALKKLKSGKYDLLLSDLEMPEMGGMELIREVRKSQEFGKIPAIALTSLQGEDNRRKGYEAGFDRYENKIQRDPLLQCIREVLKLKGVAQAQ